MSDNKRPESMERITTPALAEKFIKELEKAFKKQLGKNPVTNSEYPHLINEAAYDKCAREADKYKERIVFGGEGDKQPAGLQGLSRRGHRRDPGLYQLCSVQL